MNAGAPRRAISLRRVAGVCSCLVLAGCVALDGEQESLCRRAVPALLDAGAGVRVLQAATAGPNGVALRLWLGRDHREHRVACVFAGGGFAPNKRVLSRIVVDGAPIGDSALYYLTGRWLESPLAVAETPAPALGAALFDNVSPMTAYAAQHALAALPKMGVYALIAASYALIYGLVGRINLAFGAFAALGGVAATLAILLAGAFGPVRLGWTFLAAMTAAGGLAALYGAVAARWIVRPLAGRPGQQALIASVGLMIALAEVLRLSQGARTLWLPPVFNAPLAVARSPAYDATLTPMALAVAGAAGAAAFWLLTILAGTRFGRAWRATADEPVAAELFAISTSGVLIRAFALASGLAGLAGMLVTALYGGMGFAGGATLGLTALVAAILGGVGSVGGAMAGGVLIGAFEALWSALWPIEHKDAALFALLSLVLVLKPDGLFGGRQPGPLRV